MKKISSVHNTNLRKEIKIHQSLRHPNIIRFEGAVQVEHMVYIMLEYADNGALFFFINPRTGMPEKFAFKFFYQTALALEYLHSKGIMHRDIKPENILLDRNYDAKLCDFGWCTEHGAHLPDDESICGTYEYMPPEIVYEKSHNKEVDIWAIGVLLYELIHGRAPYTAESLDDIKVRMKQTEITFKKSLSPEAKDLLLKLLKFEPSERITLEQIFMHPFILKHLDEYENNKDSFKYIPPEPEWDNDLDIYLNGEMTSAADEAKAALSAYDDRHRFEEELLSDPVKQQLYIKKQLEDNKINGNDVEKVFFLRDEAGNLKMRLQMKDRPQPMRGNSEKKNSLARARGSEKFQRIVGPNSPPKLIEETGLVTGPIDSTKNPVAADKKQPTTATSSNTQGAFGPSLGSQASDLLSKRKDPLSIHNPQSFQALHGGNIPAEPKNQLGVPNKQEDPGIQSIGSKPRSATDLDLANPQKTEFGTLNLQSQSAATPWDKPSLNSGLANASPTKSPYQLIQEAPQQSNSSLSGPAPLLAPLSSSESTKANENPQTIRIVSSMSQAGMASTSTASPPTQHAKEPIFPQSSHQTAPMPSPLKQQHLYPLDHSAPQQLTLSSPNKHTSTTEKPDERRVLHPLSVNKDSPIKSPGIASAPANKPNSHEPSALGSQQAQAGQTSSPGNPSPGALQIHSSPPKQVFPYDQTGTKPAGSMLSSNPYNPAVNTQDSSRNDPSSTASVIQTTNQPGISERNPPSPVLQHNRSTGNYTSMLKLVPQAEALKQVLEEPNTSATKKPSAQSDLATLLGQKPNSWAKLEHAQLIYPPSYDPKNKSPQQTTSAFHYPPSKPPGQTFESGSPVKVPTSTHTAKTQGEFTHNKPAASPNPSVPTPPVARGAEATQASATAYRPLTRSVSRKEHTSNYTPPSSIPRLPTESNQSSFKAYEGNPLKQKMLTKPGPDMFLHSPESGTLKRNLISMGDRRLGMTMDETSHITQKRDEFNNTFSYTNNNIIKTETKERKSHEKLKGLSGTSGLQGAITTFKPTGNQSLVQGSQSRYGLGETSKKPPILSQKTPASLQTSKPDVRNALNETPQNKGSYTAKVFNNSAINSPREIMRNGASINEVINKNDLTAMQTDTSPTKKTSAQAITTLLTETAPKTFEQMNPSAQYSDNRAGSGAIVIRSTPLQQESTGRNIQPAPALSSQSSSIQTQVQRDKGLGHFGSSATSLTNQGLGTITWSQSRPNLDPGSTLKTLPSSTELGRPNTDSFHDRQIGYTADIGYIGQNTGGITINSRKNSAKDNDLTTKLRDLHGNELRHNTQSPLVYKQENQNKPAEVQTFGIYEGRSILERSKSQSNPRKDVLNNQLGTASFNPNLMESITTVPNLPERKSLTGLGEFRPLSGAFSSTIPFKGSGNPPLSTVPRSIQSSVKDFSKLNSGTDFGELNRSAGEAGSKTTMRYSQTHKYPRFEANGPISLEHKTLAEASNHNLAEKNLVSIYNPTTRYITSTSKEETQSTNYNSKPSENLAQQLGLKYDYSGSGPQKMQSFGQPTTTTKVFEKKQNDELTNSPSSWNRASLPGKADAGGYPSQGYSPSQALNLSSPLMNTKEYEGLKGLASGYNPIKPGTTATVISSTSTNVLGAQNHSSAVAAPISIVGRTSSSSAGFGPITTTSSMNTAPSHSSHQGPIPIQTGTYRPANTMPNSETRQLTVVYSGSSQTSSQPIGGNGRGQTTTTIYSKPREQFSPQTGKLTAN